MWHSHVWLRAVVIHAKRIRVRLNECWVVQMRDDHRCSCRLIHARILIITVTGRQVISTRVLRRPTILTCCHCPLALKRTTLVIPIVIVRTRILVLLVLILEMLVLLALALLALFLFAFVLLQLEGKGLDFGFQLLYHIWFGWLRDDNYGGSLGTVFLRPRVARVGTISKRVETVRAMADCMTHKDADAYLWAHTSNAHELVQLVRREKGGIDEAKPESFDGRRKVLVEWLFQRVSAKPSSTSFAYDIGTRHVK